MLERPPEIADGAWWYIVAETTLPVGGKRTGTRADGDFVNGSYTYLGNGTVAVRTLVPVVGPDVIDVSSGKALADAGRASRPYGRIRGK